MSENTTPPELTSRYYLAEGLVWLVGLCLLATTVSSGDVQEVPALGISVPLSIFPKVMAVLLCLGVLYLTFEWSDSGLPGRARGKSQLRFTATLAFATGALWYQWLDVAKGTPLEGTPFVRLLGCLAIGLLLAAIVSTLLFVTLMTFTKEQAALISDSKVPVAVRCTWGFGGAVALLLGAAVIAMIPEVPATGRHLAMVLAFAPPMLSVLNLVLDLSLRRDKRGRRLSIRSNLQRLRGPFAVHSYLYRLNQQSENIALSLNLPTEGEKVSPPDLQKIIATQGNPELDFQLLTLDELSIAFSEEDGIRIVKIRSNAREQGILVRACAKSLPMQHAFHEVVLPHEFVDSAAAAILESCLQGDLVDKAKLLSGALNGAFRKTLLAQRKDEILVECVEEGTESDVAFLIEQGVNVNTRRSDGWTPLLAAAAKGSEKLVTMFLDAGADPNVQNLLGASALSFSAHYGNAPIASLLIDAGASLDAQDLRGDTALIIAVRRRSYEVAELLIAAGANLGVENSEDETALSVAERTGQGKLAVLLRRKVRGGT